MGTPKPLFRMFRSRSERNKKVFKASRLDHRNAYDIAAEIGARVLEPSPGWRVIVMDNNGTNFYVHPGQWVTIGEDSIIRIYPDIILTRYFELDDSEE